MMRFLSILLLSFTYCNTNATISNPELLSDAGLPTKNITTICKDARGLMWIGTRDGLCVYDGYSFSVLSSFAVLKGVSIKKTIYDKQRDILWVATERGLFQVICSKLEIKEDSDGNPWYRKPVTDVIIDANGKIFACLKSGEVITSSPGRNSHLLVNISPKIASGCYPYRLLIEGSSLMIKLSGVSHIFQYSLNDANLKPLISSRMDSPSIQWVKNTFLIRTENDSIVEFPNYKTNKTFSSQIRQFKFLKSISFATPTMACIMEIPCKLYIVDFAEKTIQVINPALFNGLTANCVFIDKDKLMWIGTNKGLLKLKLSNLPIKNELISSLPTSVRSFCEDELGNKYCGTYSGIYRMKSGNNEWEKLGSSIPFAMVNSPGKYVYFIEEGAKLFRIDKHTGIQETEFYKTDSNLRKKPLLFLSLSEDKKGTIWIGTTAGLFKFLPQSGYVFNFNPDIDLGENAEIRCMRFSSCNNILLGTNNGLFLLDSTCKTISRWNTNNCPALRSNTINSINIDASGKYWLCTEGGGICIIDVQQNRHRTLLTDHGLSDNITYNLVWQDNYAWISSYTGISRYNLDKGEFFNFYKDDGLSENEHNRNAFLKDASGRIFFGSINGINTFIPDSLQVPLSSARLIIATMTKWDDKLKAIISLPVPDSPNAIFIGPRDHSLTLNLALSSFDEYTQGTRFSYRLKGLFREWQRIQNNHVIQLNGLPPGKYTLEIKAIDGHGRQVTNMLSYLVKVEAPFHKTIGFYIIIFIAIALIFVLVFRWRLKRLKQIESLRQKIANDLHDDLGSTLTRITMTSDHLLLKNTMDVKDREKLDKISALSRNACYSINDILWAIDSKNDNSADLADRIQEHANKMLAERCDTLEFDISISRNEPIPAVVRQQTYLMFKEVIDNIVTNQQVQKVKVVYHYAEKQLLLAVQNDGMHDKEQLVKSNQGIENMSMRAKKIGGHCDLVQNSLRFKQTLTLAL